MPRYLVVDDSRAIRVVMADTLRKLQPSATVVEAPDGESALRSFIEGRFDVVFLDLIMPSGIGGVAVLERLLEVDPRARVAIVTGLGDGTPEVVSALSAGAFAYVRKPITTDALKHVLDKAIRESSHAGTIR